MAGGSQRGSREGERSRSAGSALRRTFREEPHPLADPDETEAASLRGADERWLDGEAFAIVNDLGLDPALAAADADEDLGCLAVVAHICEALVNDLVKSDPLGRR